MKKGVLVSDFLYIVKMLYIFVFHRQRAKNAKMTKTPKKRMNHQKKLNVPDG